MPPWLHGQGGDIHYLQSTAGAASAGGVEFPGQGIQYSDDVLESKQSLFGNIPQLIESPPTTTAVAGGGAAGAGGHHGGRDPGGQGVPFESSVGPTWACGQAGRLRLLHA